MAKVRLIRSVPGDDLDDTVSDFICTYLQSPFETFLILPDAAVRDNIKRNLAEQGIPVFGASVCTLNELASSIFSSLNRTEVQIDQYVIELILYGLLEENLDRLTLFKGAWGAIHSMVPELRAFLEALGDFNMDYPRCLGELQSRRSEQLALVRDLYNEALSSSHLVDRCRVLDWVTREVNKNDNVHIGRIIFYGLFEPKPAEKEFIKAIVERAKEVEYHIPYLAGSKAFADDGSWLGPNTLVDMVGNNSRGSAGTLFSRGSKVRLDNVVKGVFRDPLDEARSVATEIRELIQTGTEPGNIAVIMPLRSKLAPLVREVFEDHGIPFSIFMDVPLSESPLVASIFSILDVVQSDYNRDAVVRLTRSPFFNFSFTLGANRTSLAGSEVDKLSVEAGIVGGRNPWSPALMSLATQIHDEIDDAEEKSASFLRSRLERVTRVERGIYQLFTELSALEGDLSIGERADVLRHLLQRFEIIQNIERDDESIHEREIRAFSSFLSVLTAMEIGEAIAPSGKMDIGEFTARLRLLASVEGFRDSQENRNAVQVSGLRASYLLRYDHVFIIGMVDGDIPYLAAGNAFIREREVRRMGLLSSEDLLRHERFYFLSALFSSNVRTYVSRSESNGSDMLVPSYFFDELDEAFDMDTFGRGSESSSALCCQRLIGEMISGKREVADVRTDLPIPLDDICHRIAVERDERVGDYRSPHDGVFTDIAALSELEATIARKDIYSASRLESYARCPFKYYLTYVLGIEPRADLETELTPADRGTLFHRIAYRFYSELREQGSTRFTASQLDEMTSRISRIGQEELNRYEIEGPTWQAFRATMLGSGARKGLLHAFLEKEASNTSNFEPKYFELSFGLPLDGEADPSSNIEPVMIDLGGEKIRLRCRIDRVDVLPDGRFVVIDYKTGSSFPSVSAIEQGIALQIPLYMQAVEAAMAGMKGIGGAYYGVRSEAEIEHKCVFGDKEHEDYLKPYFGERRKYREEFANIIMRSNASIGSCLDGMRTGRFHPNKGPAQCPRGCEHATVCRVRTGSKEGDDDDD